MAKKLEEYSADDLMKELRLREAVPTSDPKRATAKASRPLGQFDRKSIAKALRHAQKVIYGTDDRQEAFQITDPNVVKNAQAVVSLVDVNSIEDNGDGTSTIRTVKFGDAQGLCSGERFFEQPTAPHCSGFLVAPDIIATAGHCIDGNSLARTRFVFGFRMKNEQDAQLVIPNEDIYRGVALIDRKLVSTGADYALVRLDRPAQGRPVTTIRRTGKVADNGEVYVIGHPSGLPLKYAPGARVRDNSPNEFFVANLDTYGGNSGSAVFNGDSNQVEGILVRGETDFVSVGNCRQSNVCPTTGCRGEDVTRVAEFVDKVPDSGPPPTPPDIEERVGQLEESLSEILAAVKDIQERLP